RRPESWTEKKTPAADAPGSPPTVTGLRPTAAAVELLAGGPWMPLEITVERTGVGPVTVEIEPPLGVEAQPASVVVEANEPARFELRAAAAAVPQPRMTAQITARGRDVVRRTVPVTLKRLDFRADF